MRHIITISIVIYFIGSYHIRLSLQGQTNYRFLNLTKDSSSQQQISNDDYYYYEDDFSSKPGQNYLNDYYNDDESASTRKIITTTNAPLVKSSTLPTIKSNSDFYDDDYYTGDYSDYYADYNEDPYVCPSKCKCNFAKVFSKRANYDDDEYNFDYTADYGDFQSKYNIDVDCSGANLYNIINLFNDEFPLDQIVKLNLSNNQFRVVRSYQIFEDLINLQSLDLSSNPKLKGISPRKFLKKFRHLKEIYLNDLPQINCNTDDANEYIHIDCKWFKTLLYLYKRKLNVNMSSSQNSCDLKKITSSIPVLSKCLRSFSAKKNHFDNNRIIDNSSNMIRIDNNKVELKLEPDLDQLIFEGDTLELTCRFKKFPVYDRKSGRNRLNNQLFLGTKLNWMIRLKSNDKLVNIKPTPLLGVSNEKYYVSIFQSDYKLPMNMMVIESKLIIKKTDAVSNTGKYFCSTQNFNSNNILNDLNTTSVDIRVVGKAYLNEAESNRFSPEKVNNPKNPSSVHCPQFITQTYKGTYTWPKTISNTRSRQKCSFENSDSEAFSYLMCDSNGEWLIGDIDLTRCEFTSNLTRFLQNLTYIDPSSANEIVLNSELTLDKLITYLVKSDSFNLNDPFQVNKYDILYIQRFLLADLNSKRVEKLESVSWRRQFIWLNDLLARLSPIELNQARELDPLTFNMYFSNCLIPVITSDYLHIYHKEDLESKNNVKIDTLEHDEKSDTQILQMVSSFVSRTVIKPMEPYANSSVINCMLEKYKVTQQTYFRCFDLQDIPEKSSDRITSAITVDSNKFFEQSIMFMIFQDDNLFGIQNQVVNNTFTDLNRSNMLIDYSLNTYDSLKLCSQVAGVILPNVKQVTNKTNQSDLISDASSEFNLTLEIKLPENYYTLLSQIESKIINKTHELNQDIMKKISNLTVKTLTDSNLMHRLDKLSRLVQENMNPFEKIFRMNNEEVDKQNTLLAKPLNYSNDVAMSELEFELNEFDLNDSIKVQQLRDNLLNEWYSRRNYEIVYSGLSTYSDHESLDWSLNSTNKIRCRLDDINQIFHWNIPSDLNSSFQNFAMGDPGLNDYRLFSNIKCNIFESFNSTDRLPIQFIAIKKRQRGTNENIISVIDNEPFSKVIQMIDRYAELFNLDIKNHANTSLYKKLKTIFSSSYELFTNKIIYFAAVGSCIILLISIIIYIALGNRLQMPRSFYHIFINIWLSSFFLIGIFTLGIRQIHIAQLCLCTAILVHYLTLCVSAWHTLYFYSLFAKLYSLKDRNFNLLFTPTKPTPKTEYKSMKKNGVENKREMQDDNDSDYEEEEEEVIRKPVIHLYMIGWGVPLLACSVIVSITKQNYLTVPYGVCFTNNLPILIGSLLVPVCVLLFVKIIFIGLILTTLKRIINDLKCDTGDDLVTKLENNCSMSDKLKLCQSWAENKENTANQKSNGKAIEITPCVNEMPTRVLSPSRENSTPTSSINGPSSNASNTYSNQTSVMDSQHKPNMQLKFAFASYLFLIGTWILGGVLVYSYKFIDKTKKSTDTYYLFNNTRLISQSDISNLETYEFYEKLFSYAFSLCLSLYTISHLSFYLLSRDDVTYYTGICLEKEKFSRVFYYLKFRFILGNRPLSSLQKKTENGYQASTSDNIYSEPDEGAQLQTVGNKNDRVDFVHQEAHIEISNQIDDIIYAENKQIKSSDPDESLGKSISDVLFSATKKATPSTVSIKSSNTMSDTSSSVALSSNQNDLKPTLATEEEIEKDQATESSQSIPKIISVDKIITGAPSSAMIGRKGHMRQSSILSGSASQTVQVIYGGSISNKVLEINTEKIYSENTSNHYASFNNRKDVRNCSTKSTTSRKPCYVYVDKNYEEKVQIHKLKKVLKTETTFSSSNSMPSTLIKPEKPMNYENRLESSNYSVNNYFQKPQQIPHKLEDLLTKSCSNNTGMGAIGALGQLVPNLMPNTNEEIKSTTHTESSEFFRSSQSNSNKSTGCGVSVDGSTSSSISSSILMSNNNLINDLNTYREQLEFSNEINKHYDENTIYNQIYVSNNQARYFNRTNEMNKKERSEQIIRNKLIKKPSDLEVKHETSV